ncbi:hypothetical protein SCHPADRAFT_904842 [Schizopora paradoxa]|uniref:RRM Nup35-type domain-containing protein n=1 Tax=Schizopora paradoxa TaxID=27342 RepID=A0A0H2RL53_9AGAM|nr:hypothetical protein SCHPADRAFT_904842 [Schizopora paradoxa]
MQSSSSSPFHTTLSYNLSQDRSRGAASTAASPYGAGSGNMNYGWNNPTASGPVPYPTGASLNDSLSQSRSQYQPGYLLSLAQSQAGQQGTPRFDEPHLIPTRAKMNPSFPRNTSSDFGTESIFESTKHGHHEGLDDEDGPPNISVNDLVNDVYIDPHRIKQNFYSTPSRSTNVTNKQSGAQAQSSQFQTLYVVVFGYPTTRFSPTAAHFQSLAEGGTTEIEICSDVENAFKLGYKFPWEAARALRKNGEIVSGEGGRWIVGVKWADSLLAEEILGSAAMNNGVSSPNTHEQRVASPQTADSLDPFNSQLQRMVSTPTVPPTHSIGTPIKLAPSASAFRRVDSDSGRKANVKASGQEMGSPSKGVFGQVTDMIFGW